MFTLRMSRQRNLALISTLVVVILLELTIVSSEVYFQKGSPRVELAPDAVASGVIKFSRNGRPYSAFSGIPFATVPERFAEAKVITKPEWSGVKEFVEAGPMCTQIVFIPGQSTSAEEDCLHLNVFVPMNNSRTGKFHTLVWIHGGSFSLGVGHGYHPTFFMDEDVILVSINYRLGVFGFLSTGDEVVPGNNGLKDQVQALKWVKQNVEKFGGSPDQITIFGESAGSASVQYLTLSPMAKGLFQKAILQSGGILSPWAFNPNPKESAIDIATHLKCPDVSSSQEILKCLRRIPRDELNTAQLTYKSLWPIGFPPMEFMPTIEPEATPTSTHTSFMTKSPLELLETSTVDIPQMIGTTEDEGATMVAGMLLTNEQWLQELDSNWEERILGVFMPKAFYLEEEERGVVAEKLRKFYFGDKSVSLGTGEKLTHLGTDSMILSGVYNGVKKMASRGGGPIYLFQYAYHGPITVCKLFFPLREEESQKVGHADELVHQFVMDNDVFYGIADAVKMSEADEEFSGNFVHLWASFAKYGKPKHSWGSFSSQKWTPVSSSNLDNLPIYRIDKNPKLLDQNPYKERMQLWESLWRDHFGGKGKHGGEKTEL